MGKLANLAASRGIILPDETALRLAIRGELKSHAIPPPSIRQRHYRSTGTDDQNEMDRLSDSIRQTLSLPYPADLVNSLVKQVITIDETAARASAKAAARRVEKMAGLEMKEKELKTATAESQYHICQVSLPDSLVRCPELTCNRPSKRPLQFNGRPRNPSLKVQRSVLI